MFYKLVLAKHNSKVNNTVDNNDKINCLLDEVFEYYTLAEDNETIGELHNAAEVTVNTVAVFGTGDNTRIYIEHPVVFKDTNGIWISENAYKHAFC